MNSNRTVFRSYLQISAVLAALLLAANLNAAPPRIAGRLQAAYDNLSSARKDYAGHKAKAMDEIAAAAKELNVPLTRTGRAPEHQRESDLQLRDAQKLLVQARSEMSDKQRQRAGSDLNRAIEQINLGLKTK